MIVEITPGAEPRIITVAAPDSVTVTIGPCQSKAVTVEVFRDGRNGKSAYEVALDNGFVGTEQQWLDSLKGDAADAKTFDQLRHEAPEISGDINAQRVGTMTNLREPEDGFDAAHKKFVENEASAAQANAQNYAIALNDAQTLETVRQRDNRLEGDIDAQGNSIKYLRNASDAQEPLTKGQGDAILQAAKDYSDTNTTQSTRWVSFWDFTGGNYPNGISGGIKRGDEFEASNIDVVVMPDGTEVEKGDIVRARIGSPGQTPANWSILQGNSRQATEAIRGIAKVATSATVADANTTNDGDFVTAVKLWLSFVPTFLAKSLTWTAKQIFADVRLSGITPGALLKVNASCDVVPAVAGTDYQVPLGYTPENAANKDASGGYVGLSGWKIKVRNLLNTNTSFIQTSATTSRTWTLQDRDGTLADLTDISSLTAELATRRKKIYSDLTQSASTTGTGRSVLKSCLIQGGAFSVGYSIETVIRGIKTGGTSSTFFLELWVSTSNTFSTGTATLLCTTGSTLGSHQSASAIRFAPINSATETSFLTPSTKINSDDGYAGADTFTAINIDHTVNQYYYLVGRNASSVDSCAATLFEIYRR